MKITLEQLKKLIRESIEEARDYDYYDEDPYDTERLDAEEKAARRGHDEEDTDYKKPVGEFDFLRGPRGPVREGAVRLIYTNHGILTEERVRELKECGYRMEECGSWDVEGPRVKTHHDDKPVEVVILGPGLEEGGMASTAGTPSYSGNQGAVEVGPQGIQGSAGNPGGANVPDPMKKRGEPKVVISPSNDLKESFNRRAERLLEAWMEEELRGDQNELDVAPPYGKLTGADFKNLGKKSAYKAKTDDMNEWYTNDEYYTDQANQGPPESEADRKARLAAEKQREADSWEGLNPYTGQYENR